MLTAMYRFVSGAGFVCTVREDGRIVAEERHASNIKALFDWRAAHYPAAEVVASQAQPSRRPRATRCDWCGTETRVASVGVQA